jgi:hypothetical protein
MRFTLVGRSTYEAQGRGLTLRIEPGRNHAERRRGSECFVATLLDGHRQIKMEAFTLLDTAKSWLLAEATAYRRRQALGALKPPSSPNQDKIKTFDLCDYEGPDTDKVLKTKLAVYCKRWGLETVRIDKSRTTVPTSSSGKPRAAIVWRVTARPAVAPVKEAARG